ncbi:MAG: hypothetical protein U0441_35955 [Polyangiaceae bacterium]
MHDAYLRDADAVGKIVQKAGGALIESGGDGPALFDVHVLDKAPTARGRFGWAAKGRPIEVRGGKLQIRAPESEEGETIELGAGTWAVAFREGDYVPPPPWGIQSVSAHGKVGLALDATGLLHVVDLPSLAVSRTLPTGAIGPQMSVLALTPGRALVTGLDGRVLDLATGKSKRVAKDQEIYTPIGETLWATWNNRVAGVRLQDHGGADKGALKGLKTVAQSVRTLSPSRVAVLDSAGGVHLFDVTTRERVTEARLPEGKPTHLAATAESVLLLAGSVVHELDAATLAPRRTLDAGSGALAVLSAGAGIAVIEGEGRRVRWLDGGASVELPEPAVATATTPEGILAGLAGGVAWIPTGAGSATTARLLGDPPETAPSEGDYVLAAWRLDEAGA